MPTETKISVDIGGQAMLLSGMLEDDEKGTLEAYCTYATQLLQTRLVREGGPGQLSVKFDQDSGWSYSTTLPPDDDVIALLHRMRPFILTEERTNFYRVCSIASKIFDDPTWRSQLKRLKKHYSGQRFQSLGEVKANGVVINSEEMLLKWLNAHEYHKDIEKQQYLEDLHELMPLEASRAIFIMMVYQKVESTLALAGVAATLLGKQQRCSFTA